MSAPGSSQTFRRRRIFAACAALSLVGAVMVACSQFGGASVEHKGTALTAATRSTPSPSGPPLSGTWKLAPPVPGATIEGFAEADSVLAGANVGLRISATARYHVEAYRMGFYSGTRAQLVWASGYKAAHVQPPASIVGPRRTVTTHWGASVSVPTRGWKSGLYLFKLVGDDGAQSCIPLLVRASTSRGAVVLVSSVGTWQAYNQWGGANLYRGSGSAVRRSRAVSFDRPYDNRGLGIGLQYELPLISVLEQKPVTYAYASDLDLGSHPEVLTGARGVIFLGHSEYWTPTMRANVVAARDRGANLAFLGANDVFWRARAETGPTGADRVLVSYKSAAEDPVHGAATTVKWAVPPGARPSSLLTGQTYGGSGASAAMVIRDPASWLVRGTGVKVGTRLPGLIGPEYDYVRAGQRTVAVVKIVAASSVVGHRGPRAPVSHFTWYQAPSGAVVVDVGTMGWGAEADSANPAVAAFVRKVTTNVAERFLGSRR